MQPPVLAYNRIRINERRTRWLIASFAVALLPVLTALAVFVMPWVSLAGGAIAYAAYGPALEGKLIALQPRMSASAPAGGPLALQDVPAVPASVLLLTAGLIAIALLIVLVLFFGTTAVLIRRYGARMVLRTARARSVERQEEPDLFRLVENLCIGAGLPMPALHIIESPAANAFATGLDPQHASLVVTRGLLTLLDRRELEGVIAHELSHIGNHDIRLTTTLAALVTTASLPFRMIERFVRGAFRIHWVAGAFVSWMALLIGVSFIQLLFGLGSMADDEEFSRLSPLFWWWAVHAVVAPAYAVFVAPVVALVIRQTVSRQREFLADADAALLTRNPNGLALALVKIGASRGERLRVGEGFVHLYFVDPAAEAGSLLHRFFPSHPPLGARIDLLGRMGSGIAPSALQAAIEAAAKTPQVEPASLDVPASLAAPDGEVDAPPAPAGRERSLTPLYENPDGWSRVLAHLPPDAAVTVLAVEGNFIRVATAGNLSGYVSRLAPLVAVPLLRGQSAP